MRAVISNRMWRCGGAALAAAISLSAVQGAEPVELRYQWESGARYGFDVEVTADHGEAIETLQGTPILQVQSAEDGQARLQLLNKQLGSTIKAKNPRTRVRAPVIPRIPTDLGRGFNGHELTLDDRGRVVNQRGESQLPFVLGNLAQLLIEPFPAEAAATWTNTESTTIRITSEWPPRSPFRRDVEQERLNAEESTTFTITDVTDDTVVITKEYRLATVETVKDQPRMELTGSGEITFDRRRRLPSAMDYEANFIVREDNQEVKHPLTVRFRLLSDEELAAHEEQVALAAAERKAPPTGEQRASLLEDLTSGDVARGRKALIDMQPKEPSADQEDVELAAALAKWLSHEDQSLRHLAGQSLEKWATQEEIPELLAALDDDAQIVANSAMKALGRLRASEAVERLVENLSQSQSRLAASEALKSIGADAEEQTLTALDHADWVVRLEACRILQEIGTEKSVEALRTVSQDDENGLVRQVSQQAADAIESR